MGDITVAVTAHNEEASIATTLESLQRSIAHAEAHGPDTFDLVVVLDRCTDRTEAIASGFAGLRCLNVTGGLIEAQRVVAEGAGVAVEFDPDFGPVELCARFVVFCDADVEVGVEALHELASALRSDSTLVVAYAASVPAPPARSTLLANALHTYNANDGFEVARHFFSGRCFAIRSWQMPRRADLDERLGKIGPDRFFRFHDGLVADDIYLSKSIAHQFGSDALRRVPTAVVVFRPPATLTGMYRYARRMRAEVHRVDRLFPELRRHDLPAVGRRLDRARLAAASRREQLHWLVFQVAYRWCLLRYFVDRNYYRYVAKEPCPLWPTVIESKAVT